MLKSISLENYKCFDKLEDLEIAPLTILCGVNSSGKSSILKSLLMLKQSFESNYDKNSLLFNGDYTTNGSYADVVTDHKFTNNVTLSNKFVIENSNFLPTFEKNTLKDLSNFLLIDNPDLIDKVYITFKIILKRKSSKKYIHDNIIFSYLVEYDILTKENKQYKNHINISLGENSKYIIDILSDNLNIEKEYTNCSCFFQGLTVSNIVTDSNSNSLKPDELSIIYSLSKIIGHQYKGIKYIAPLRKEPTRIYTILQDENDIGLYGEFTPQVIYTHKNDNISFVLPPQNNIFQTGRKKCSFIEHINRWCSYLGIEDINIPSDDFNSNIINFKIGHFNYDDVGFGISQILPILTTCFLMKWHETLILQQPEIHLHPKMQMNFADFLLCSAYTGKNIIIETHSDHIINRVLRRVLERPLLKDKVKIYFIDKNSQNNVQEMKIDLVNGFINAPEDFFSQYGSESSAIFNASINNMSNLRLDK